MWHSLLLPATSNVSVSRICFPSVLLKFLCSKTWTSSSSDSQFKTGVRYGNGGRACNTRDAAPVTASTWRHTLTPYKRSRERTSNLKYFWKAPTLGILPVYPTTGLTEYYFGDHLILRSTTDSRTTNQPSSWHRTLMFCVNRRPCIRLKYSHEHNANPECENSALHTTAWSSLKLAGFQTD
jgi:hypothetical protein